MIKDYFIKYVDFSHWANSRILKRLQETPEVDEKANAIFSHLLTAEKVWLMRIHQKSLDGINLFPLLNNEECLELIEENKNNYLTFLDAISEDDFKTRITYKNSEGKEFNNSLTDIFTHLMNHGSYHRGQINLLIRKSGGTPTPVDFIVFLRG